MPRRNTLRTSVWCPRTCLLLAATSIALVAANQTSTLSPIVVGGGLPYGLDLRVVDFPADHVPTLHSFVKAQHDGKWILLAGRTNGLHDIAQSGLRSFPPAHQNREVWVVDPTTRQSWRRSLEGPSSGLTAAQIDSLSGTNAQFYQEGSRLYVAGGYGLEGGGFTTFDTLSAIDLPGITEWVQNGSGTASDSIRQLSDPAFRVTGGAMERLGGRTRLVFGQDFSGGYGPHKSGNYTNQVRSFEILDDGNELSIANLASTEPNPDFRRRDLNVLPILRRDASGELEEGLVALSGVFTDTNGAWTVPVEIDADGGMHMDDPSLPGTFRQGMNNYHGARTGLYSEESDEMHMLLFGGITLQYYDRDTQQLITDEQMPFTNQITSIVIDSAGRYTQHLHAEEFPAVFDDTGKRLRFGAGAEFLVAEGVPVYDNGVLRMDELLPGQTLGYIVGGIVADQGNGGNTAASNLVFEVLYHPVPEPRTLSLVAVSAAGLFAVWIVLTIRRQRRPAP